ncbi:hypothetical protein [Micromonospora craniellae]|uniref:Uncharacterized protein n=1 Tax=Micromonospora craniellae TaxID=2294034 RepID=A0A372FZ62_9ACTN|nr:hypothetical protein [Micromonospora craniellae]QOC91030.1 hypothetical protein ID554_23725 [Micromonospora craniellae]RFS45998.1 hypothetical protein D0Q02_14165 [Micromonospora craniellae]
MLKIRHARRTMIAGLVGLSVALAVPAGPAAADVYATNDITAGHIDIVNIECPSSPSLALTTKLDSGTPINPTDLHNYAFVHQDAASPYVSWVPTTGTAGYWQVSISSATMGSAPWVGFNFNGSCAGSGNVWLSQASAANPGRVELRNSGGSVALSTATSATYALVSGQHTHFEWRFYASSKPTTAATYRLYFGFGSNGPPLSTQNWLEAEFVIVP